MKPDRDTTPKRELQFFGIVTASISHEIKNALAVISESAGLMEDLLLAAERGMPLDESRLKKMVNRIQSHVKRGDGIVRNMNAFAHSVDQQFRQSDISQIVRLSADLAGRMLDMKGVSLNTVIPPDPVFVTTAPFVLKNLTWLIMEFAAERLDESRSLRLAVEKTDKGALICFSGLKDLEEMSSDSFPPNSMRVLLDVLESRLEFDGKERKVILELCDLSGGN